MSDDTRQAVADMAFVLATDYWNRLSESERDLIAANWRADRTKISAEDAALIAQTYATVVGTRI